MVLSTLLPPVAYGIGTAVPVIAFAIIIAFAGQHVGKAFDAMTKVERWFRCAAGVIFVAVVPTFTRHELSEFPVHIHRVVNGKAVTGVE